MTTSVKELRKAGRAIEKIARSDRGSQALWEVVFALKREAGRLMAGEAAVAEWDSEVTKYGASKKKVAA